MGSEVDWPSQKEWCRAGKSDVLVEADAIRLEQQNNMPTVNVKVIGFILFILMNMTINVLFTDDPHNAL